MTHTPPQGIKAMEAISLLMTAGIDIDKYLPPMLAWHGPDGKWHTTAHMHQATHADAPMSYQRASIVLADPCTCPRVGGTPFAEAAQMAAWVTAPLDVAHGEHAHGRYDNAYEFVRAAQQHAGALASPTVTAVLADDDRALLAAALTAQAAAVTTVIDDPASIERLRQGACAGYAMLHHHEAVPGGSRTLGATHRTALAAVLGAWIDDPADLREAPARTALFAAVTAALTAAVTPAALDGVSLADAASGLADEDLRPGSGSVADTLTRAWVTRQKERAQARAAEMERTCAQVLGDERTAVIPTGILDQRPAGTTPRAPMTAPVGAWAQLTRRAYAVYAPNFSAPRLTIVPVPVAAYAHVLDDAGADLATVAVVGPGDDERVLALADTLWAGHDRKGTARWAGTGIIPQLDQAVSAARDTLTTPGTVLAAAATRTRAVVRT